MYKIPLVISIFCMVISFGYSQTFNPKLGAYLDEIQFSDDRGTNVTMYAISRLKDVPVAVERVITGTSGLSRFDIRKDSYKKVLMYIAFQEEFDVGDVMTDMNNISELSLEEKWGYLSVIQQSTVSGAVFFQEAARQMSYLTNLKYVKNTNLYTELLNKMKTIGLNIRHSQSAFSQTSHFAIAFESLGTAMDLYSATTNFNEAFSTFILIRSVQTDFAIARIKTIRETVTTNDQAFWQAINEVEQDLNAIPTSIWKQIIDTGIMRQHELVRSGLSLVKIGSEIWKLAHLSSKAAPWIGAILFTAETLWLIKEWKDNFRDATCAASLYHLLHERFINRALNTDEYLITDLEYAQFLFLKLQVASLDNWPQRFWELFNRSRGNARRELSNLLQQVENDVVRRRVEVLLRTGGKPKPPVTPTGKLAIGLILDSSGSMSSNDPRGIRKTAAELILNQIDKRICDVFLIDFDGRAIWLNKSNFRNWNKSTLVSKLKRIDSAGGTDIGSGLYVLRNALKNNLHVGTRVGVLLLTDGKGSYKNEAQWFQKKGIPVYTVGLVGDANAQLLNSIALLTGGDYTKANSADEIVNAFNRFYAHVSGSSSICLFQNTITQGGIVDYSFYLDPGMDYCFASCVWAGSKVGLDLFSPDGKKYSSQQSGKWWSKGSRYVSFNLKKPAAGLWKAKFTGLSIPAGGEPFTFEVNGKSPVRMDLTNQSSGSGSISLGLTSNSNHQVKINKHKVTVTDPSNQKTDISGSFSNNQLSYIPASGKGNYIFHVELEGTDNSGNPFQRFVSKTVLLGDYIPVNIGPVTQVMGNYITAKLGRKIGNRSGITCIIYPAGKTKKDKIALGYVTFVNENECSIQIQQYVNPGQLKKGCLVELNLKEWKNDTK